MGISILNYQNSCPHRCNYHFINQSRETELSICLIRFIQRNFLAERYAICRAAHLAFGHHEILLQRKHFLAWIHVRQINIMIATLVKGRCLRRYNVSNTILIWGWTGLLICRSSCVFYTVQATIHTNLFLPCLHPTSYKRDNGF